MLKERLEDIVLQKVRKGKRLEEEHCPTVEELMNKGLLSRIKGSIKLTPYGLFIQKKGFKKFEEVEKFEKNLRETSPMKPVLKISIVLLFLLLKASVIYAFL